MTLMRHFSEASMTIYTKAVIKWFLQS